MEQLILLLKPFEQLKEHKTVCLIEKLEKVNEKEAFEKGYVKDFTLAKNHCLVTAKDV
jgi:hypothetical protein